MGPWGGFITGLAGNMEYVITPAVVVGAMGFLSHDIVFDLTEPRVVEQPGAVVVGLLHHLRRDQHPRHLDRRGLGGGDPLSAALAVLAFFFVAVIVSRSFDASLLTNIPPEEGGSSFLPKGIARSSPLYRSRSGSTSQSRNCPWPPRNPMIRSATSAARRCGDSPR